jgi:hypothetical protein
LYAFLYHYLAKKNINLKISKIILISFTIIGVVTTTAIIKGSMMQNIALSYSIASIITGLYFKLNFELNK